MAGLLGMGIFCYVVCKGRKYDYGLLPQFGVEDEFKDDDESKEKEIFSRPLNRKFFEVT